MSKSTIEPVKFAQTLRRLGETIDGRRDDKMMLVKYEDNGELEVLEAGTRSTRKFQKLWETPTGGTGRRTPFVKIDRVLITYGKNGVVSVPEKADALFWTDSALEKFVFPYYEQVRIQDEEYLTNLKKDIRDPARRQFIIAVEHDSPSHSESINVPPGPPGPPGPPPGARYLVDDAALIGHARTLGEPDIFIAAFKENGAPYAWLTPTQFQAAYDLRTNGAPIKAVKPAKSHSARNAKPKKKPAARK